MKKTLIERIPGELPEEIIRFCEGARVYDSSCSPEARVYFIDRDEGYYLKSAHKGSLKSQALMTEYFHKKGLGGEMLGYFSADRDLLLMGAVQGDDCIHEKYLSEPKRLCDTLALRLRELHELDFSDCPITDVVSGYIALSEENYRTGRYDKSHFPDSFGYSSAEEAYSLLISGKKYLKNECLIHGDYCLPNIMLDDWKFSGFIDLGQAGVGDRHIDIFWGSWTFEFNLKTKAYYNRFLDAYGRDKVENEKLRVIAAASVFG